MRWDLVRVAGVCSIAAVPAFLLFAVPGFLVLFNLLQLPGLVAALRRWGEPGWGPVNVCLGLGLVSVLLWLGASLHLLPWAVEPAYILLSAAWFAGVGWGARRAHRAFAVFCAVTAVAALVDAVVTGAGVSIGAGAPKLFLQLAWLLWLGILFLRLGPAEQRSGPGQPDAARISL